MKRIVACCVVLALASCEPKSKPKPRVDSTLAEQVKRDVARAKKQAVERKRDFEALLHRK